MWLFTKDGFFSTVADKDNESVLVVRARRRGDLERLAAATTTSLSIEEGGGTDYLYRAKIARHVFAEYMYNGIATIDYTGVKDNIDIGEPDRHRALYRVWSAMMSLQPSGKEVWGGLAASVAAREDSIWFEDYSGGGPMLDIDDVVGISYDDMSETHDVHLHGADDAQVLVDSFLNIEDAERLAEELRKLIGSWDVFDNPYIGVDDMDEPEDDDSDDDTEVEVGAALKETLRRLNEDKDD